LISWTPSSDRYVKLEANAPFRARLEWLELYIGHDRVPDAGRSLLECHSYVRRAFSYVEREAARQKNGDLDGDGANCRFVMTAESILVSRVVTAVYLGVVIAD
jgi:hypothetical protein